MLYDDENLKIALVHDWLTNMGGAEKVVECFMDIFPEAPIYTTMANKNNLSQKFQDCDIITSFLQKKLNLKKPNHSKYFPFMPAAFESFDLNKFDVVLSSSSSCAKGAVTSPQTLHICYCHSPMRYAYEFYHEYTQDMGRIKKFFIKYFMNYMRVWDVVSSNRVDYFIANSKNVARRIYKHYRRESVIIYPPVNTKYYASSNLPENKREDFFLCVSRLVPYKKIDLVVKAFNDLKLPLVVIGEGTEFKFLKSISEPNVKILGRQPDEVIRDHYCRCKAFLFPGEEDFGITPVEAQACGCPVIAFGKGGALETVIDGETGLFFSEQTTESLKSAIIKFNLLRFNPESCRKNAERFGTDRFKREISEFIRQKYAEFNKF